MSQLANSNLEDLQKLGTAILLAILFWFILLPYFQTEILTTFYTKDFNINNICQVEANSDFKFSKIIFLEKATKKSRLYCIYLDSDKNVQILLNYNGNSWEVISKNKLNTQRNYYWPIYV